MLVQCAQQSFAVLQHESMYASALCIPAALVMLNATLTLRYIYTSDTPRMTSSRAELCMCADADTRSHP